MFVSLRHLVFLAPMLGCSPSGSSPSSPPPSSTPPTSSPIAASTATPAVAAAATTVFVVRHGEKSTDDPRDPSLSPAGEARAQALAVTLAHAGVTHCFASEYRRTQATLRPLAAAIGREITVIPAADPQALVAAIRELPAGSVVAVAGHSNTVPAVVAALGGTVRDAVVGPAGPVLPDDAYDRLFVVHTAAGSPAPTLELRYGAP